MVQKAEMIEPVQLSEFEYRAFISYSRADKAFADELHDQLSKFRTPRPLRRKQGSLGTPPRQLRVFIDTKGAEAGGTVPEVLASKIRASAFLIVICSASSKHSEWVNEEIELFAKYNGVERILPVFLREDKGTPLEQAMPPALSAFGRDIPMGADVLLDGGSLVVRDKLVGAMIGFAQDEISREQEREDARQRRTARRTIAVISALLICAVALGLAAFDQRQGLLASRSEFLSKQARQSLDDGNTRLAQLLAIESIRNTRGAAFPAPESDSAQHALIWTLASAPVLITRPTRDLNPIRDGKLTSDGAYFVALDSQEQTLQFFDTVSGEMVRRIPDRLMTSFSSSGETYLIERFGTSVTNGSATIEFYRIDDDAPFKVFERPSDVSSSVCDPAWSPSDALLAFSCRSSQRAAGYVLDVETGTYLELWEGVTATGLAISENHVAASFGGGRVVLFDARSGQILWDRGSAFAVDVITRPQIHFLNDGATLVATLMGNLENERVPQSPDQFYQQTGQRFGEILIDVATGETQARFNGLRREPLEGWESYFASNDVPEIYPIGKSDLLAVCKTDDCYIWSSDGEFVHHISDAWSFVASGSGNLFATWGFSRSSTPGASGDTFKVYRASDGEMLMIETLDQDIQGVRFSEDDRVIAAWGATDALNSQPDLRIWRLPEQTEELFLTRTRLPENEETLYSDFRRGVAVVKRDGDFIVRTPGDDRPYEVEVELESPIGFAFSDDLRRLAVFSESSLAGSGIWDTRTGDKIVQFTSDFGDDAELELDEIRFPAPRAAFIENGARVIGYGNPEILPSEAGRTGSSRIYDDQFGLGAIVWDATTGAYSQSAQEYFSVEDATEFCANNRRLACEEDCDESYLNCVPACGEGEEMCEKKSSCLAEVEEVCSDQEEGYLVTNTDDYTIRPSGEIVTVDRLVEEVSIWQDKSHKRRTVELIEPLLALDARLSAHSIFAPDRPWIVVGTTQGGVLVFDYQSERVIFAEKVLYDSIMSISLTSDGRLIVSADTGEIAILRLPGGEQLWRADGAARHSLSPDEKFLALFSPRDRKRITIVDMTDFLPVLIADAEDEIRDFYFDDTENEVHIITVSGNYVRASLPKLDDAFLLELGCRNAQVFPAFTEAEASAYLIANPEVHSCDRHGLLSPRFYQKFFAKFGGSQDLEKTP